MCHINETLAEVNENEIVMDAQGRIDLARQDGVAGTIVLPRLHPDDYHYISNSRHVTFSQEDAHTVYWLSNWAISTFSEIRLSDENIPLLQISNLVGQNSNTGELLSKRFDFICVLASPLENVMGVNSNAAGDQATLSNLGFYIWEGCGQSVASRIRRSQHSTISASLLKKDVDVVINSLIHSVGWPDEYKQLVSTKDFEEVAVDAPNNIDWFHEIKSKYEHDITDFRKFLDEDIVKNNLFVSVSNTSERQIEFLSHIPMGTFLRIRNAELSLVHDGNVISSASSTYQLRIDQSSHLNIIQPYFKL